MSLPEKLLGNSRIADEYTSYSEQLTLTNKIVMLLLNAIPLALVATLICIFLFLPQSFFIQLTVAFSFLLLMPPLMARMVLLVRPIKNTEIKIGSSDYFTWWFLLCLQTIFSRFGFVEECLRIIPGLYSAWLRLWGSKVGKFTYWAPGVQILDRSFLKIGDNVIFGSGVRLNPHVISKNESGEAMLFLDSVTMEDDTLIGGYSLLTTGTLVLKGSSTAACTLSPPNSTWKDGKRIKNIGAR